MIPLIIGAIGLGVASIEVIGIGATAGMSYGIGRKYGRKFCEFADNIEGRVTGLFTQITE